LPPLVFFVVYAFLVGLIVGSYLNVVIHRLPNSESTVTPRSRCPSCGAAIRARDNLPLVSFLLLRGRCRDCAAPISIRYPLVEGITALLFAGSVARFGATATAAAGALFCALLVALAGIDLEHFLLPDKLTLPGIALGLALQPVVAWGSWPRAFQGALAGAGLILAISGLWRLWKGIDGMGLGDAKMLAMIGAFLGLSGVVVTLVAASFAGAAVGLTLLARGAIGAEGRLPFGFFLALGGLLALFAGAPLTRYYVGLL
jgi:leader peptidase (prepilin peptidase)/N-methyltransferase